jgi:hypothetical protein
VSIVALEYRLARQKERQFISSGERYPTKGAAREAAPDINRARVEKGMQPLTHILTLPARGSDAADPSHFLSVEPL